MGFGLKGFRGTEGEEGSNGESISKDKLISKGHSELQAACSQLCLAVLDIFHSVTSSFQTGVKMKL